MFDGRYHKRFFNIIDKQVKNNVLYLKVRYVDGEFATLDASKVTLFVPKTSD